MSSKNTIELNVSRLIKAPPDLIYSTWLDSSRPGSPWFGTSKAIVNPIMDGLFYHSVHYEEFDYAHYGRFILLEKNKKIQHTWVSEATSGVETVLTVMLKPRENETLVKLHHTNVPDDKMGRQHEEGWNYVLSALSESFSN